MSRIGRFTEVDQAMPGLLRVKNWDRFQHYRDRCPPWIKLSTDTFQNVDFSRLQSASKLLAICIWTLASRSKDGSVPDDLDYIAQWGFLTGQVRPSNLEELVNTGFVIRASNMLAERLQVASKVLERDRGEAEREAERETEKNLASSDKKPSLEAATSPPVITLPLNDKTEYPITQKQLETWLPLYPAVDVRQQLNNMRGWCLANPAKCKTKTGVMRFVNGWLAKEQNHGGGNGQSATNRKPGLMEQIRNSRTMPDFGSGDV